MAEDDRYEWIDKGLIHLKSANDFEENLPEDLSKSEKNPIFGQNSENEDDDMLLDEIDTLVDGLFNEAPKEAPVETPVETPTETPNEPAPVRRVDKPWRTPDIEDDPDPKAEL